MQKPQQRKYHSSCNRSVHRGTAHGKQEVKVCKRKTPHLFLMRSFLPPCGDGTELESIYAHYSKFSPPYGDGTLCQWAPITSRRFSPPYGDSTDETFGYQEAWAFPSPCEDKLKSMLLTPTTWASSFRPLAGMVPATFDIETTNTEFSPPYGDCIRMTTPKYPVMELSPPYGDGTSASVASAHDL